VELGDAWFDRNYRRHRTRPSQSGLLPQIRALRMRDQYGGANPIEQGDQWRQQHDRRARIDMQDPKVG